MNYFTPELYSNLQNFDDAAMDAADAAWDDAVQRYENYLQVIRPELAESVRQLLDGFYLHDANVLSIGERADDFVMVLQLDVPPHDVLTISYNLESPPRIKQGALPPEHCSPRPVWMYDEIELIREGDRKLYQQSILLSNGWEVVLRFRDVGMTTIHPFYPPQRTHAASGEIPLTAQPV